MEATLDSEQETMELYGFGECQVHAVDLIGSWVEAGVPEKEPFAFNALDGSPCEGAFAVDLYPLLVVHGVWYEDAPPCKECHYSNSELSKHQLDMGSYAGILVGANMVTDPPGQSILGESAPGAGDFHWERSTLHARLRNDRMPPGYPFDPTEDNLDGPSLTINGIGVRAVDMIGTWVEAGAPEAEPFGEYGATFEADILPLFVEDDLWFEGSQACTACHAGGGVTAIPSMDLSSYAGILAGEIDSSNGSTISLLGETTPGAGDFDWEASILRASLRNNRMPPEFPFDISGENRDGPVILAGKTK